MENAIPMGQVLEDDKMPALENQNTEEIPGLDKITGLEGQEEGGLEGETSQSRAEKKSRKAFSKLGLKPFEGVKKVTIKQAQVLFIISKPSVYKLGNSYVIFGKVQIKDNSGKKTLDDLKEGISKTSTTTTTEDSEIPTLEETTEKLEEVIMDEKKEKKKQFWSKRRILS